MLRLLHQAITLIFFSIVFLSPTNAIRPLPATSINGSTRPINVQYIEAPEYRNAPECPSVQSTTHNSTSRICDPSLIHISITLDSNYLRGSVAAVHSILRHTSCPENVFFHFIASAESDSDALTRIVSSAFPSLGFRVYPFAESLVKPLISSSIREALENPLNYARTYVPDLIDPCVTRVIYLDSDTTVVDDIRKLWSVGLPGSRVIGAPVYCHAKFTKYFTDEFWSDPELSRVFEGKRPCYFNTGVMVMDLVKWREGGYKAKVEKWMGVQKERRIYELGSLPPFLLVFGGEVEEISHRWNQHGLGGNNVVHSCRPLHPGPVSLLHWSGKGKPWVRLDAGNPCPVDHLWAPYDLFRHQRR